MKSLRKLCTAALGAVVCVSSVAVPLALAGPAAAGPSSPTNCTPDVGYDHCLRFDLTGNNQTFTVPSGTVAVHAKLWGAGGGGGAPQAVATPAAGGGGGFTTGTIPTTSGQTFALTVGQGGSIADSSDAFIGGGSGGIGGVDSTIGSAGGGMSAIWSDSALGTPVIIAGGGGGAGGNIDQLQGVFDPSLGGGGGGGANGLGHPLTDISGGGASQIAGGVAASAFDNNCGSPSAGSQFEGGAGGSGDTALTMGGGGGGGGYFGGGGGACLSEGPSAGSGGAGGGGSAFTAAQVADASTNAGDTSTDPTATSNSGGSTDSQYVNGIGTSAGGSDGQPGEIVLEWDGSPALPSPADVTSTGVGIASQSPDITAPAGGTVRLLDSNSIPVTSLTTPGEGTYTVDPVTNVITFVPILGFRGDATPVTYELTNTSLQTGDATYTPNVTPPAGPTPGALTSSGTGTASQTATVTVPDQGSATLFDGLVPTDTVIVLNQGTYTLDPNTGVITFVPVLGFSGPATPVTYRVSDAYGTAGSSTYTPTVSKPAGPTPAALTSSGTGSASQGVTVTVPLHGADTLLNGLAPTNTVTVQGQGTYSLDPNTSVVSFAPVLGFSGPATPVTYQVTDAYATSGSSTYTPTVHKPAGPTPVDLSSSGSGTNTQSVTVTVPQQGSVALLDSNRLPTNTVTWGQGTYTLNPATGVITFVPRLGYSGGPDDLKYRVTDAYGTSGQADYWATVNKPAPPAGTHLTSTLGSASAQHQQVTLPPGGTVMLGNGVSLVTSVTMPGQGTYTVVPQTGALTFTPVANFMGPVNQVKFRVTDAYGQNGVGTYNATVSAYGTASASAPAVVQLTSPTSAIPVTCKLTAGIIHRCDVTLTYGSGGKIYTVGSGTVILGVGGSSKPVTFLVRPNALGRYLALVLGGVPTTVSVKVTQVANPVLLSARTVTRFSY